MGQWDKVSRDGSVNDDNNGFIVIVNFASLGTESEKVRRTINISVSEELFDYIRAQRGYGSVSEYIRSLVRSEQQRRADLLARTQPVLRPVNDSLVFADALDQIDRLKALLEGREPRIET